MSKETETTETEAFVPATIGQGIAINRMGHGDIREEDWSLVYGEMAFEYPLSKADASTLIGVLKEEQQVQRVAKQTVFAKALVAAEAAGQAAGSECKPADYKLANGVDVIPANAVGSGRINLFPGSTGFCRYLKSSGIGQESQTGKGWDLPLSGFTNYHQIKAQSAAIISSLRAADLKTVASPLVTFSGVAA